MPELLVDLGSLNLTEQVVPDAELRSALPHAHEFRLIDEIRYLDLDERVVVGRKEWPATPWWARAHVPGRPLMPGVLMVEGCAQVAAVLVVRLGVWPPGALMALGGVDNARFRRSVAPPATIWFAAKIVRASSRMVRHHAQCIVEGEVAAELEVLGVPL